jgi:hypothetical protein
MEAAVKYLDRIANIAIIVAVAVFLGLVARGEFFRHKITLPPSANSATALVGRNISVPGIHFPEQQESLVLGISANCHFCKDSLPFYRKLPAEASGKVHVIAVLPQPQSEAETFVKDAGLTGTQVVSANLASIGVIGTPTLLLLDGAGKVKSVWIGEQDQAGQQKILAALGPNPANAVPRS